MTYTMRQATAILEDSIEFPLKHSNETLYLEGPPGIGKTALAYILFMKYRRWVNMDIRADKYKDDKGKEVDNIHLAGGFTHFIPYVAPEREPTDWGLPMPNAARDAITMMPLDEFRFLPTDRPFILFDEVDKANNMMQNTIGRVAWERAVGNIKLPENSYIMMGGNRMTDRTGSFTANTHIKGRRCIVPVMPDVKEWIEDVAIPFGLHPSVISFNRTTDILMKLDTNSPAYPSPRGWTRVGEFLNRECDPIVEDARIKGTIGVEAANAFHGHLKIFRALRSPEAIIANPGKVALPSGKDATAVMWAEVTSLAKYADTKNADAIFTYMNRLPGEFAFCGYRDVMIRDQKLLVASRAGQSWMVANAGLLNATKAR